jgi:alcohol dehydrogenase (NADP+)
MLGADEIVVSNNPEEMNAHAGSFDFILDRVAAEHDINAYLNLLKSEGTLVLVGLPETPLAISAFGLALDRRSLAGSYIGGIAETQHMLDFCGKHNIVSEVEIIRMNEINESYERLLKGDQVPLRRLHGLDPRSRPITDREAGTYPPGLSNKVASPPGS